MLWVLPNLNSRLIVKPQRGSTRWRIAKFRHKIPKPDSIRASIVSSYVLSLMLKSDPQTSLVIVQFDWFISLFIRFFGLLVFVPRRCLT